MEVLLKQFGHDFVVALEVLLQLDGLLLASVLLSLLIGLLPAPLEGEGTVFEQLLLPSVVLGGLAPKLLTQIGDGAECVNTFETTSSGI